MNILVLLYLLFQNLAIIPPTPPLTWNEADLKGWGGEGVQDPPHTCGDPLHWNPPFPTTDAADTCNKMSCSCQWVYLKLNHMHPTHVSSFVGNLFSNLNKAMFSPQTQYNLSLILLGQSNLYYVIYIHCIAPGHVLYLGHFMVVCPWKLQSLLSGISVLIKGFPARHGQKLCLTGHYKWMRNLAGMVTLTGFYICFTFKLVTWTVLCMDILIN